MVRISEFWCLMASSIMMFVIGWMGGRRAEDRGQMAEGGWGSPQGLRLPHWRRRGRQRAEGRGWDLAADETRMGDDEDGWRRAEVRGQEWDRRGECRRAYASS